MNIGFVAHHRGYQPCLKGNHKLYSTRSTVQGDPPQVLLLHAILYLRNIRLV